MEREIIHDLMKNCQNRNLTEYNLKKLSINIFNFSDEALTMSGGLTAMKMEAPQLPTKNSSFIPEIWMPLDALHKIPAERRVVALVSYMNHSQFQFNEEQISSMVLRIELLEQRYMQDLTQSITMIFQIEEMDSRLSNNSKLQCRYFNEQGLEKHSEYWKTDGCEATVNKTTVTCKCNHATPFAVLLIRDPIAEIHWMILSYISYIGCGLSAFFCALSFLIYIFGKKNKMDFSMSIHVSLSGALFLLNSTFLLTEWGATVELSWVCEFVAAFMHYSLLCSFTWMAIEAFHLYLLLVKVFNTYYKYYLLKLSAVGWGVPGLIVAVSLGVKDFKQLYGAKELTMLDSNQTSAICWIIDDSFFYSLNLVYFILIFIFNSGILMAVGSSICRMNMLVKSPGKCQADQQRFNASCRSGLTLLGLTCLLGTTWGLAFLGSGYVNYPVLYLFCILNSLQGFFIFMWICFTAKRQRKRQMEEKLTSTPMRTSALKSE
ncbi:adhesion G-protein coupled receptor G2 [Oryzias melastigma]|uniref:adhesion G-protein coupled receptor G2 n=1 Tax=Oryzias melastigma TaxID=30732 RepID=UPI00168CC933|nr:adhesion G-protein coupled receptor G2 [Oryzias melastigma]XP_036067263.1 adhesion G-protein coupled receptor G2 [Oryzias melastigma]XP_036067264.1 adhesion G-protein coupled receptor G2 [Oryzias melastigma]